MSTGHEWSPDQPQGNETFEQGDEAFDEEDRLDPNFAEAVQRDPSIDPANELDELELEEAGLAFDDPEAMVTLQGGGDDPDGIGEPLTGAAAGRPEEPGWDLDNGGSGDDERRN